MALAGGGSKEVVVILHCYCCSHNLLGFVLGPCFAMQYVVSFLVVQSSFAIILLGKRESCLLYFCGILNVMFLLSFFASSSRYCGLARVCDCGISRSYSLNI